MSDKYAILDNNREPSIKPVEEVLVQVNGLVKEMSSIRSDIAVIKNRVYEIMKQREEQKKQEALV